MATAAPSSVPATQAVTPHTVSPPLTQYVSPTCKHAGAFALVADLQHDHIQHLTCCTCNVVAESFDTSCIFDTD